MTDYQFSFGNLSVHDTITELPETVSSDFPPYFWIITVFVLLFLASIAWAWTLYRQLRLQINTKKESEDLFHIIFRETPSIVLIAEFETGKLLKVNRAFEIASGYGAEEVLGIPLEKTGMLTSMDDRDTMKNLLAKDGKISDQEYHFLDKKGEIRTGLVSATRIMYKSIPAAILVITDISNRKKLETELLMAKEQAIKSDKLKSAFLANMSHEIRTPMNVIVGFAELLTDQDLSDAERNEYVDHVKSNSYYLLDVINDIINISKIESGTVSVTRKEIDTKKLAEKLCSNFHFQARQKNLEFEFKKPEKSVILYSDDVKVHQILSNILSNAIKFTTSGKVSFGYYVNQNYIEFKVEDTGCGFPEERLDDVFERFIQVQTIPGVSNNGTGLGLPIAKAYAELLGGSISASSVPGIGSGFTVRLPLQYQGL
ncbi:PAS domain-containing sensor histidine kinase [Natronoflexus pectinivorans]|uniref:PAS domain-containing sensor histidine kinase n=1 Tax=Natronoflexus pectinivorans TaxID=682526 RepID=UPI00140491A5|nr:PAS domain-containing sensor histidine kinase [Natronoflexus pectinivorans]